MSSQHVKVIISCAEQFIFVLKIHKSTCNKTLNKSLQRYQSLNNTQNNVMFNTNSDTNKKMIETTFSSEDSYHSFILERPYQSGYVCTFQHLPH